MAIINTWSPSFKLECGWEHAVMANGTSQTVSTVMVMSSNTWCSIWALVGMWRQRILSNWCKFHIAYQDTSKFIVCFQKP